MCSTELKGRTASGSNASHFLCHKDDKHRSDSDRSVRLLRDAFMLTVNTQEDTHADLQNDMASRLLGEPVPAPLRGRSQR